MVQPDEGGDHESINESFTPMEPEGDEKINQKFEVKLELVKMDVEVSETSKFQVRIRTAQNQIESSKKYKVSVGTLLPFQRSLSAYVEFDDDYFTQSVTFEKFRERFKKENCLLEFLCNEKVVSCNELELT